MMQILALGLNAKIIEKIRVCYPDGHYSLISFNADSRLEFGEDDVIVRNGNEQMTFSYLEIAKIDLITVESSGILKPELQDVTMDVNDGIVTITGLKPGVKYSLCNVQGVTLLKKEAKDFSKETINLNKFDGKLFILSIGNRTFKFSR